jgi:hypothetical protein
LRPRNILILIAVLAIAITAYFVTQPGDEPPSEPDPLERIWQLEMDELEHIRIELPNRDMDESFLKHEDRQWYFDDPPGPQVDPDRWGGGIPLILSNPAAERPVTKDATEEQLAIYGFTLPQMKITLTKEDEGIVNIEIGDAVPDGSAYYIRLADSNDIYIIDGIWYGVLERLLLEPPYPSEEEE